MSIDGQGQGDEPLTRAQLRAAREGAARAAAEAQNERPLADAGPEEPAASALGIPVSPDARASESALAPSSPPSAETPVPEEPAASEAGETSVVRPPTSPISGIGAVPPLSDDAPETAAEATGRAAPAATAVAPQHRRFTIALAVVVGILLVLGGVLTAVSLLQGPRVVAVQVDPRQAIESSGSRVILTANQPLAAIDQEQVVVEPAVPFTVDAAGRNVGIRFTAPLDDSTTYTVTIADAERSGGGPQSTLTTSFRTPKSEIFLLQRSDDDDKIFTTDLTGEKGVPVFSAPRIVDFRMTPTKLVVAVEEKGGSRLIVMNRDGSDQRDLTLPGEGYVSTLQVSDRGNLVAYSYSDADLSETSGRASALVTQPLTGKGEPRIVQVGGEVASISDWQFVPDTSSLLFIDFNGGLALEDPAGDAGVKPLGTAAQLLGVTQGTFTAIVQRASGDIVELNLADGSEQPMPVTDPDYGPPTTIVTYPGGALQHVIQRDEAGMPTGQAVITVAPDGAAEPLFEVSGSDAILQLCASPSGQYAAITVAPQLVDNPYDDLLTPLPKTLHTHLIDMATGKELVTMSGFDVSWCSTGPQL